MNARLALMVMLIGFSFFSISCSKKISEASSDEEFAQLLSDAFKDGDYEAFNDLTHPDSSPELESEVRKLIKPFFDFEPHTVSSKFIEMTDVEMELPGSVDGRQLEYTSSIDGVLLLDGTFETEFGEGSVTLTVPFVKLNGRYYSPSIDFAADE